MFWKEKLPVIVKYGGYSKTTVPKWDKGSEEILRIQITE